LTERINLPMQITEAEAHARELQTAASRSGKGQSAAMLRYRSALAIISTLHWIKDHEPAIKASIEERKAK